MITQEYVRTEQPVPKPQERRTGPENASPEDWVRFLRTACAGCHQEPC